MSTTQGLHRHVRIRPQGEFCSFGSIANDLHALEKRLSGLPHFAGF